MSEDEYIKHVCNAIKSARISKQLTQADLAFTVGIDDGSLRRIESGRTSPTLKTLYRISHALEMDVKELLPNLESA